MKNKIHFSPKAVCDADEIWEYTVETTNRVRAQEKISEILATIEKLEKFAEMGAPLSTKVDFTTDYRYLVSGQFLIFYRTKGTDVYVLRILNGKTDYLRSLFTEVDD